jgi:membrane protein CcdC involved in cytochrome C biogenesis
MRISLNYVLKSLKTTYSNWRFYCHVPFFLKTKLSANTNYNIHNEYFSTKTIRQAKEFLVILYNLLGKTIVYFVFLKESISKSSLHMINSILCFPTKIYFYYKYKSTKNWFIFSNCHTSNILYHVSWEKSKLFS